MWGSCFWFCTPVLRLLLLLLLPLLPSSHTTHSSNTLSTYTLSTHSVNTHFVNIHFCQHTLCHHFVNIHFAYSHLHTHTQHTLCQHTLLSTHTLSPLCQHTLCLLTLTYTHTQHTLCQHTLLSTHTLSPLSQHTLCLLTLTYTHTHNTHFVNIHFCQHTLCHHFVNIHFAYSDSHTHTHTRHTLSTHTLSPHIHLRFAWQAWHNLTSTVVSRGRRGTNSHSPSFCVAGVALMVPGGALGPGFGACDAAALCVAGVAQTHIYCRFTWQAWHELTFTVVLRGRRGTYGTWWRPWARIWRLWRRGSLRGRRGTSRYPPSFHVAGVARTHIHRRFAWQAWHLWYRVARLGPDLAPKTPRHFAWQAWHKLTSTVVSRGRRGTNSHSPSFCVAGVALMVPGGALGPGFGACDAAVLCVAGVAQTHIYCRFTWQAWHELTFTVVLRGRRGTYGTGWRAWARIWRLWRRGTLRGRRGTTRHPSPFHVAGVARTHIHRRFAWQAWHLWYLVARLGPDLAPVTPRHFAWQAWYNSTSIVVSRGRRGTNSHSLSFCVAGVALMVPGGALVWFWLKCVLSFSVQRCDPSGMFCLVVCFGMFDFGMFQHFLLSACDVLRHVLCFILACLSFVLVEGGPSGMFISACCFRHVWFRHVWFRHVWFWHVSALSAVGLRRASACFMFYFGMFKFRPGGRRSFRHVYFGMLLSACLISACLISACFNTFFQPRRMLPARCWFCFWSKGSAQLRCSNAVTQQCYGCCFLHANFHPVVPVVVVLFWSLRPN